MLDLVGNFLGAGVGGTFTVVAAPLTVAVLTPNAAGLPLANAAGRGWFEPGDNLVLTGIQSDIGYGFGQAQGPHLISIFFEDSLGNFVDIPELGGISLIEIPALCEMMDFPPSGLFIRTPTNLGRVRLNIQYIGLNVSMVNVPTGLVGETVLVNYSLRVNHTLDMSLVP